MVRSVNPYRAGKAIDSDDSFFGRDDIISWVSNELRNKNTNCLVLFGQRRIGKTTLLLKLDRYLPKNEFLPVVFDLQYQAQLSLGQLLFNLTCAMAVKAGHEPPEEKDIVDDRGHIFRSNFLPRYLKALPSGLRLVILFDEFDVFEKSSHEIDKHAAGRTLFAFLSKLMDEFPMVGFVFVAGRNPDELSIDYNTIFKQALTKEVWVLDIPSARNLIRQAETTQSLVFSQTGINRILKLTNGHPYLTQLLCQRIWEKAYANYPKVCPEIGRSEVDDAIDDAFSVGTLALEWWWQGLSIAEKVYASALAEVTANNVPISEKEVIAVLSSGASRLRTRQVEYAPKDLVKRRVLDVNREGQYGFAIEMLGLWIRNNRSLDVVKEELDRINEPANQLYEAGRSYYLRQQLGEAKKALEDAIKENPQHLKALLLLGDIFIDLNQPGNSIKILERANKLDDLESSHLLSRAWVALAKDQYSHASYKDALRSINQAKEISFLDNEALELNIRILENQENQTDRRKEYILVRNSRTWFYRLKTLVSKPVIFNIDHDPESVPLYPRIFLEQVSFAMHVSLKSPLRVAYARFSEWLRKNLYPLIINKDRPFSMPFSLLFLALWCLFVLADTIVIANTLAFMGLYTEPTGILLNYDLSVLIGSLGPLLVGSLVTFDTNETRSIMTDVSDRSDVSRGYFRGLSILITVLSVILFFNWALSRLIEIGNIDSTPFLNSFINIGLYGIVPINAALASALIFQYAFHGILSLLLLICWLIVGLMILLDVISNLVGYIFPFLLDVFYRLILIIIDFLLWIISIPVFIFLYPFITAFQIPFFKKREI